MRRFVGVVLPAPWDVQPARREPQIRPLAVVRPVGPRTSGGTAYVRHYVRQWEIFAYPPGNRDDPQLGYYEAERVMNDLVRALDSGHAAAGSKALRVPLYDFSGVTDTTFLLVGAQPIDYLVVSNVDADIQPDPEQDGLFTVMVDLRVNWSDDGDRSRYDGAILEDTGIQWQGTTKVVATASCPWESS